MIHRYYFTFGSDPSFPFQNGWIIVEAENKSKAIQIFRKHFPDRHENCINCSFVYAEEEWKTMNPEKNWKGYKLFGVYS